MNITSHWLSWVELPRDQAVMLVIYVFLRIPPILTIIVNFMCQLEWAKDAQITGKMLFLGMSTRVFPKEISSWFSKLSKEICLHQSVPALSNLLRAWIKQKGRGSLNSLYSWAGTSIFSCLWTSGLGPLVLGTCTSPPTLIPVLRPLASIWESYHQLPWFSGLWTQTELYHWPSWLSSLQMVHCSLSQPP